MTLELNRLTDQIETAGALVAERVVARQQLVHPASAQLELASAQPDLLEKIRKAGPNWTGAKPTDEPIAASYPPPNVGADFTVVAADGSQIYPDAHSSVLYYVINVGGIVYRNGSGAAPTIVRQPALAASDDELLIDGFVVTNAIVNLRRTTAEMNVLAELATQADGATAALIDGPLALRSRAESIPDKEMDRLQLQYFDAMDRMSAHDIALAGYVDRPGGGAVMALLELSALELDELPEGAKSHGSPAFGGLQDRMLFAERLGPGARSAVFEIASGWNRAYRERLAPGGESHSIHFFYLNVGEENAPAIARVECPAWVAKNETARDRLHDVLVDQCSKALGPPYPYVLARADEEAVIQAREKTIAEEMLLVEVMKHNVIPVTSAKQTHKQWARYGRNRRRR